VNKTTASAESAMHRVTEIIFAIETRFQRFGHVVNPIPGALPQAEIE